MLQQSISKLFSAFIFGIMIFAVATPANAESNHTKNNKAAGLVTVASPALCTEFVGPDFNHDCYVDMDDYRLFQLCMTGPDAGPPSAGCETMDLDEDGDVDELDFTTLPPCTNGPEYLADATCEEPAYSPPTSLDRIDDELAAGLITELDALRYKVFEVFGDDRLPSRFYGATFIEGTAVVQALSEQYGTLPIETQNELRPFLLPPDSPGSWYQLSVQTASTAGGPPTGNFEELDVVDGSGKSVAVVKWPTSLPILTSAQTVQEALSGTDGVYQKLVALMGRDPISDGNLGAENNGGDGRYDVYLLPQASRNYGWTSPHSPGLFQGIFNDATRSSYIVLDIETMARDFSGEAFINQLRSTMAHEFMHVLQFAFDLEGSRSEYWWLGDATATWAEHYIFPNDNTEHIRADKYLRAHDIPLEVDIGNRRYGSYLYFFHHVAKYSTDILRFTYQSAEVAGQLEAIDNGVPGGISDNWAEFTVANWNDWKNPPVNGYQAMDNLKKGVSNYTTAFPTTLAPRTEGSVNLELTGDGLEPLSAQYFHFKLTDTSIRSILFVNGLTFDLDRGVPDIFANAFGDEMYHATFLSDADTSRLHVMALVKQNGVWLPDPLDLTKTAFAPFCQEAASESIEEIVFIMANARFEDHERDPVMPKGLPSRLFASNIGCGAWAGTAQNVYEVNNPPEESTTSTTSFTQIEFVRDTSTLAQIAAGSGQQLFGPPLEATLVMPASVFAGLNPLAGGYRLTKAVAPWSHFSSYQAGSSNCSELGSGTMQFSDVLQGAVLVTSPHLLTTRGNEFPSIFRPFFISMAIVDGNENFDGECVDSKGNSTVYDSAFGAGVVGGFSNMEFGPLTIDNSGNRINQSWTLDNNSYQLNLQSKNIP